MFGIGNRVHPQRDLLEPPYPVDVIADLHAGVYPDDFARVLKPRVLADPDGAAIWAALEATTAQLAALPASPVPVPPFVQERIDQTMTTLADNGRSGAQVTWLSRRRGAVAASLAAVAAVVGIAVAATFAFTADSGDSDRAPVATPTAPAVPSTATLLSVLGNSESTVFADRTAQDRCLLANQIQPSTTVLGVGSIDNAGGRAVVILLATGTIGTFDALVVGTDCTTGNPATISRTTIGDK